MSGLLQGVLIFVIGTVVTYGLLRAVGSDKAAGKAAGGHDAHGHGGHGGH